MAYLHEAIGNALYSQTKLDASLAEYRTAFDLRSVVAEREPLKSMWQTNAANAARSVGDVLIALAKADDAREWFGKYRDIVDRLAPQEPWNSFHERDRAEARHRLARGADLSIASRRAEARALMQEAVGILRKLRDLPGVQPELIAALPEYETFLASLGAGQ